MDVPIVHLYRSSGYTYGQIEDAIRKIMAEHVGPILSRRGHCHPVSPGHAEHLIPNLDKPGDDLWIRHEIPLKLGVPISRPYGGPSSVKMLKMTTGSPTNESA